VGPGNGEGQKQLSEMSVMGEECCADKNWVKICHPLPTRLLLDEIRLFISPSSSVSQNVLLYSLRTGDGIDQRLRPAFEQENSL
jgi:hypothetical protein